MELIACRWGLFMCTPHCPVPVSNCDACSNTGPWGVVHPTRHCGSEDLRSPRSERAIRSDAVTMLYSSKDEMAFKRQPGLRHGCRVYAISPVDAEVAVGGGSGQENCVGIICQHALDPGSCCALVLLTNADLKADITLLCNIISKPQPT